VKSKKRMASNRLFYLCLALGVFFGWGSVSFFIEDNVAWGWGFGVIALLLTVIPAIFTPYCYVFDRDGISLRYVFLPVERYLWKDIYAIEVEDTSTSSRSLLFELLFAYVFAIKGQNVGKKRFYMNGHVRKTHRTKKLFEAYWDGTITGYLFEDTKAWIRKRKAKKQKEIKQHFTDEIVPMEREIRADVRNWLTPLVEQAKQYGLSVKATYVSVTKDGEEHRSRPHEGYTYRLIAEIAHANEDDEARTVAVSVDLLYVRLGKTAYRGVKNEHAQEELQFSLSDVLNEIHKNGIETYCRNEAK